MGERDRIGRERDRIVDQLRRAFEGDAWHGPSVLEVLQGVTARKAAAKPLSDAHSIWEITLHVAAWEDIVRRRILGEKVTPSAEQDWPPVGATNQASWKAALQALRSGHMRLREAAADLGDADLDSTPPGTKTPRYVLLHGAIQHDLYHAGQIAILKKGS